MTPVEPLRPLVRYRWLRRRLSGRGDTEHEQALIRMMIVGGLLGYALVGPLPTPPGPWWPTVPQLGFAIFTLSLLHFAWIVADPAVRRVRRALWSVLDHVGIVLAMAVGGEPMALLYPLMLWVTLGHGFRYGGLHMIGSALVSVALFVPLVTLHPYWQLKGAFAVGLILGLVVIPAYCLRLLKHLHDARRRAEASSEAKSRFLATMSHELRTPLHAILGMADLLRAGRLASDQREMVRTIHTSGHGLLNMIEDVLDIARIEAGAERIEVESFDTHRLLHEVRDMLAYRAATKGLALRLRFDPELVAEVEGPRRAVHQILVNLLANAVKFTDVGFVRMEAALRADDAGGHRLELAVVDSGCGIPASAQTRVFESFSQVDETTTRQHGGSGLGLAIVKRLVDGADGTIELTSEIGAGTRFDVTIPVRPRGDLAPPPSTVVVVHGVPDPAQAATIDALGLTCVPAAMASNVAAAAAVDLKCPSSAGEPSPPRRHGRALLVWDADARADDVDEALFVLPEASDAAILARAIRAAVVTAIPAGDGEVVRVHAGGRSLDVLVADDHEVNRKVIGRLLAQGGHRCELVGDGNAALEALGRSSFDAAVLDLNMPGLGGLDVARRLQADPRRPRLLALTADATADTRAACAAVGFDAFLTKPVDAERLLAALAADAVATAEQPAPAPPAPSAAAVIDRSRLRMLHQLGDASFVQEVVESFIADGERLVDELTEAAAEGDVERFRDAAHALRSAATHLGATALFDRCLAVKSIDPAQLTAEAATLGDDLARTFAEASAALREAAEEEAEPAPVS